MSTDVRPAALEDVWPLAPMQSTMLLATLRAPRSGVFIQQEVIRLEGPVPVEAFQEAWRALVARTATLRTSFHWEGLEDPIQAVHRDANLVVERMDWGALDAAAREIRLGQYLQALRRQGFDLQRPPLIRLALIQEGAGEMRFVWQFHHILFDGWSAQLLVEEIREHCRALLRGEVYRPPVRPSFRSYIDWLQGQHAGALEAYWRGILRGFSEPTDLHLVGPPSTVDEWTPDAEVGVALTSEESERVRTLARQSRLTLNTVAQGAWALMLSRYADRDDVLFGCVVSGRPPELPGVEQIIGLFINSVPVRVSINPAAAVVPWLQDLQRSQAESAAYHHARTVDVQRWSELLPGTPLFDTLLVFENFPSAAGAAEGDGGGLDLARADVPLTVMVLPGSRLQVRLRFDPRRFRHADMVRLSRGFALVMKQIAEFPYARLGDVSPLMPGERARLTRELNATDRAVGHEPDPLELLGRRAAEHGTRPAFLHGDGELSFEALDTRSSRLALRLREEGVGPGSLVGVCAERSFSLVVAFYAVLKAGAVYLPLDPAYPPARLEQILDEAQPSVLLTSVGGLPAPHETRVLDLEQTLLAALRLESGGEEVRGACPRAAEDPVYVVYTSGSTGKPKGVLVPWRQVVNRLAWMWQVYPFEAGEVACQRTPINFVDSLWELLGAPLQGFPTVIVPERAAHDPDQLMELLARHGVTRLWVVPSLLRMLLDAKPNLGRWLPLLRFWVSSGEPLPLDLYRRFQRSHPGATLYNLYGTSEIWDATWFDPNREPPVIDAVPIGRPIWNTTAYVLDRRREPLPFGVAGELYIGGHGVAHGYLADAALTEERFVADPFAQRAGARLYRTGDLAAIRPDGLIEHLGRRDRQVKLRGFRIEPAEIEAALQAHPAVREAVAVAREARPGDPRLVGYVALADPHLDPQALTGWLRERLPAFMVPSPILAVEAIPLTPNGKRDLRALPPPHPVDGHGEAREVLSPLEGSVAEIFAEVLRLDPPRPDADFFRDLGGHSLLAIRVASRLAERFKVDVPLGALFDQSTPRELARWLSDRLAESDKETSRQLEEVLAQLAPAEREALLAPLSEEKGGANG